MLEIIIPGREHYDEKRNEFIYTQERVLRLEHSLVSISKWESKWHKPFLSNNEKTVDEIIDYVRCMTITQSVDIDVYNCLTEDNMRAINDYIDAPMTATTFNNMRNQAGNREVITSEIIYYWMITFNIPFECEKWHLNRLLTLVKVCNLKSNPPKKMSKQEIINRNKQLNAERRKRLNTNG